MKVVELRELNRRDSPVHYIKEFTGVAILDSGTLKAETDISFTLEHKPLGPPDLIVRVMDPIDWPLLPIVRALREHILDLEKSGRLP
ncbi:MAG TPA: hypothetical protein VMC79_04530 [Rectinemataceae bacterium]|nr:hypothetical protein [Rectinemataceae bacterium]